MDSKLRQRFEKYENVLFLYNCFKMEIRRLCAKFYNKKLEIIFCEYNDNLKILNEEEMKKKCGYHKLLIKFNDIMSNNFLSKEKRFQRIFKSLQF